MKVKRRTIGNGTLEKNRLFSRANSAWDKGDLRQAFALFTQAAELGDVSSQLDLGYFFDQGLFVKKDRKKALEWYRRAYRQGDAGAANNIATVYRELGDVRRMLWWLRRAAAMGDIDVLFELGKRYEKGLDVSKNAVKAEIFYRRALANKCATEDDKARATARLTALRERTRVPHKGRVN